MADKEKRIYGENDVFAVIKMHNKAGNVHNINLKELKILTVKQVKEYEKLAREYHAMYRDYKAKILKMDEELEQKAQKVEEFLEVCENKKHIDSEAGFALKYVEPHKVVFDPKALEKKITDEDVAVKVIKKKLVLQDEIYFKKLLRRYNITKEDVARCFLIERAVDAKALEQAIDMGEIEKDVLQGTYTVEKKKAYIKVSDKV